MRALAVLLDLALALILAGLLATTTGWYFAERAVVTFRIHSPETIWNGPLPLVLGAVSTLSYGYAFALLLVLSGEVFFGASTGKLLVGKRVLGPRGTLATPGSRLRRWLCKAAPWWLFCLGLVAGAWPVVVAALAVAVVGLADLGWSLARGRECWYDRQAGTHVGSP